MTSYELVQFSARLLDNKKATDIEILEIGDVTSLGDYFIIASGRSTTQVKALAGELEDKLSQQGLEPRRVEGETSAMWILMDYGDVIVHIFNHDTRDFYSLERLWSDAKHLDVQEVLGSTDDAQRKDETK